LAVDSLGNLYISDNDACVIRLVNPSGLISTLAGNGSCGTPTSGLQANTQSIGLPQGLAVDIAGNVYFSDRFTSNVYRVGLDGILTSLNAGCCAGGDGGPFSAARLFSPQGLYVSPTTGTLYIADQENHRVRAVIGLAPTTGTGRLTLLPLTYTSPVQNTAYLGGTSLPVVGGTGTGRVFSVIGGALPSGITMDSSNGRIVGTPTVSGTFSFTAQVTEPGGRTAVGVYSILVLPPLGTSVAFTVMPNSTTLAGQVFGVVPAVAVGPAVAGVQVSLSLMGGGGAVLSGPTSALTNAAGSATFPGLSIDRAGDGYRLLATLTNGNTGLSNSFNILGAPSSIATAAGTAFINTATGVATSVQLNPEEGLLYDAANNALLISDSRSHRVVSVSLATGALTNKFGTGGPSGFSGDGGQASAAKLNFPLGMTRDSAGNIYLVDGVSRIRRITPAGVISTIAGNGSMGYSGDGGQATAAGMNPTSVAFSSSANALYVADHSNHRVRRIDLATGVISTVAGNGTAGFSGDGSAATAAQLNWPVYVAVDLGGSLIISDHMNSRIRKVTFPDGNIVTIVGSTPCGALGDGGAAALGSLCHPRGIFLDNADNLFIADMSNHRVRKVAGGGITTVAGNGTIDFVPDGGLATANSVYEPRNITLDATGNLYINEGGTNRVRRVNAIINSISTIAGTGSWSFSGDGGGAVSASFRALRGITFDGSGNYYVADSRNFRIRRVTPSGTVSTVAGSGQIGFSGDGGAAVAARFGVDANAVVSTVGGTLYIADYSNDRVRRVSGGSITTFAGGGGSTADNIPATTALISRPRGLALDPNRNLLYISYNDSQIARVDLASGNLSAVSGIAGNNGTGIPGVAATSPVGIPESLAVDPMGNLYVADLANSRIYRITPGGILSILAGNGTRGAGGVGGPALAAQVSNPSGLYADGSGVLYVSDHGNNTVRRIGADAPSTVTAIVNPGFGSTGDGGPASLASVSIPWGLAANPAGDLFIVDDGDTSRVRRIYGAALSSIPVRLTITTTAFNLEVGGVPVPGSSIVQAVGGTGARTWEATGLPPSMSINPSTGAITGTFPSPLGPTTLTFTVTVTDSLGQTTSGLVRQPLTMP
jgi:sugar lactone lactonase YvrE